MKKEISHRKMGDTRNGEKERKMVFVTKGKTLFDALVKAMVSWEVKQELLKRGYTNLVIQMGHGSYTPTKVLYVLLKHCFFSLKLSEIHAC